MSREYIVEIANGERDGDEIFVGVIREYGDELIRCRNCAHWVKDEDCGMVCRHTGQTQPANGFCNWAREAEK